MPKGKQAAALFEVINRGRAPGGKAPSLRTPAWWNKNKQSPQPAAPAASTDAPAPINGTSGSASAPTGGSQFKLTYRTGTILGVAIAIALLLAYFAGKHGEHAPGVDRTTADLERGPGQVETPEIKHGEKGFEPANVTNNVPADSTPENTAGKVAPTPANNPAASGTSGEGVPLPANGKRVVGLNYVVVQSYPEEKDAAEARDVLIKAGIPATIERHLRGFNSSWYTVVGTDGFDRVKSPAYAAYVAKIERVSSSFAKKRSFKAFTPIGYKWDRADR